MPVSIGRDEDFPEGEARRIEVDGKRICIVRAGGRLYGIDDVCSHAEAFLSEGEVYVEDLEIECPLHGSTFSLETGAPDELPATEPVTTFTLTSEGGQVLLGEAEDDTCIHVYQITASA